MIYPSDVAKYLPPKQPKPMSIVEKANQVVDIRDIYNALGFGVPSGEYFSWKIVCPFGDEHSDGGIGKNCRIYPPTNIFCWEMHGFITPVRLYARVHSMPSQRAAKELLEQRGLLAPKSYRERWLALTQDKETGPGPKSYVIDALQKELAKDASYADHEYDDAVRKQWAYVLDKLDALWTMPNIDVIILQQWLDKSAARIRMAYQ